MHFAESELLSRDATVRELLKPLLPFLEAEGVTEVCINRPQEVFVESGACWTRHEAPQLTLGRCQSLATAIATYTEQEIGPDKPILSAVLPAGERVQVLLPPVIDPDTVTLSIRRPGASIRSLGDYETEGAFARYAWAVSRDLDTRLSELTETDRGLITLLRERQLGTFLDRAVKARKNIAVVGETGSGKTTLMKTLCQSIPTAERLLTIEDVRELLLPGHPNRVHLLYSKGGQGVADITPAQLIASAMRMKPDRVLLAELRGAEAFDFLKLLTTGHAGSITSYHAESCALAAERYAFMAKEHEDAAIFDPVTLKRLVALTIDITLHVTARNVYDDAGNPVRRERFVSELSFDPIAKLNAQFGDATVIRS